MLGLLPVGVILADGDGRVLETNAEARRIWGWNLNRAPSHGQEAAAGLQDSPWHSLQTAAGEPAISMLRPDPYETQEMDIETGDGSRRTIMNAAAPFKDHGGRVANAVVVNLDITYRKRMEDALRHSRALIEGQKEILELIARGADLPAILSALTEFVQFQFEGGRVAIDLAEPVAVGARRSRHLFPRCSPRSAILGDRPAARCDRACPAAAAAGSFHRQRLPRAARAAGRGLRHPGSAR